MTLFSIDASADSLILRSPVRPSPDPGLPPGSGIPLDFSDGFAQTVTDSLHAPDGDGIEHYPGFLSNHFTHATSCRTDPQKVTRQLRGDPASDQDAGDTTQE